MQQKIGARNDADNYAHNNIEYSIRIFMHKISELIVRDRRSKLLNHIAYF